MKKTRVRDRIWLAAVRTCCCCVLFMLAELAVLCTTLEASESPLKTAIESGEYRLMPGDKLGVFVFDQEDFSGDFAINGAGEIMLPLAGTAKVTGLTLEEARQLIEKRLSDGILVHPNVSVRIVDFRPIFVTGRVRRPGNYPFIAGMSVKAAIATAGGEGEPDERMSQAVADAIMADERVRQLETDRLALLLRKARLEHQRDEVTSFNVPQIVGFGTGNVNFTSVYAAEKESFTRLVEVYHNQLQVLQEQRPRIEAEIQAVNAQIVDVKQRLEIVSKHLAEYEDYAKRGYVRKPLVIEQQIQQTLVQAELSRLEAQLAHLQQGIGDLEIRKAEVAAIYQRQIFSELQDTSQRLLNIDATLGTARELRHFRADKIGFGAEEAKYSVRITRARPEDVTSFDATYDTKLEPGDVVEIKRIQNTFESSQEAVLRQSLRQEFAGNAGNDQLSSSGNFAAAEGQAIAANWTFSIEIGYGSTPPLISASAKIEKPSPVLPSVSPPPDPKPNRTAALPFAMKGTLAPAIVAPAPPMAIAPKASRSETVKTIQHTLVALGHSLTVDGVLGPITIGAIEDALANMKSQSAEGPADGLGGSKLLASRRQQ